MKKSDLSEHVPDFLREQVDSPNTVIPNLLPQYLTDLNIESAYNYISGALWHQEVVNYESSKWFPGTIKSVETIERKSNGSVFGRKARIHFLSHDRKNRSELTEQSIDTGWIEFFGWSPEKLIWDIALARTIQRVAKDNIDQDMLFQKMVQEKDDGEKVRSCINIKPRYGSKKKESAESTLQNESDDDASTEEMIKKLDSSNKLQEDDIEIILDIVESPEFNRKYAKAEIAYEFGVEPKVLRKPVDAENDVKWTTLLYLENI